VEIKFKNPKLAVAALKAVSTHASEDATRPHIQGVYFDLHPDSLDIVATDGDCLALYRFLSAEYESDHFVGGVTVPLASCLAATKSKPGKSFSIETGPSGCRLANGDVSIVFTPVDGSSRPTGKYCPINLMIPSRFWPLATWPGQRTRSSR
jgi:DNA polymerase III sliding clamp (beta) subunit (PCNA family)